MIEVSGVSVSLGRQVVLAELTCSFPRGVTALVGRNGAGKTTLIRTLCGLVVPTAGEVVVGGVRLLESAAAARQVRAGLGWMPQDPPLPARARVVDVVRYAAWLRGVKSAVGDQVEAALTAVDLVNRSSYRVGTLSGGQQRRVALACALVGQPAVMLLDEPTVGLDPEQRDHFLEVVRAYGADRTVVLSTHLMEDVLGAADHVVVVAGGSVVRSCSVQQLTTGIADEDPATMMVTLRRAVLGEELASPG